MSFDIDWWWPLQEKINLEFGFSKYREDVSSRLIKRLYEPKGQLTDLVLNRNVTIIGGGINDDDLIVGDVLIAADGAVSACLKKNFIPDIIVTDLDGNLPDVTLANKHGSKVVVHAHGDNLSRLFQFSDKIQSTCLTTTYPTSSTDCWGGFTDGDRALMMSLSLGANLVTLVGFDFQKIGKYSGSFSVNKIKKLSWANKIVAKCQEKSGKVQLR